MKYAFTLMLALVVVLAACTAPAPADQQEQQQTQPDTTAEPEAQAEVEANADVDTTTVGEMIEEKTGEALQDLMEIARNYPLEFMVVYDMSGAGADGEMTAYYKRANVRYDMMAEGIKTRTLVLDDVITSCSDMGQGWNCLELSMDQAMDGIQDIEIDESDVQDAASVESAGTMQVAGTTATCFRSEYEESTTKQCFSAEGVLLYSQTTDSEGQTTTLEATEYSTTVSDSVFVLPAGAQTQNIDAMMENMPDFDPSSFPQY